MKLKDPGQRRLYRLLSFLIPFAVTLVCFTLAGMYPFGESGPPLFGDAAGEYYPNMVLLRRLLENGESLRYTWRAGLGASVSNDIYGFSHSLFTLFGFLLPESMFVRYLSLTICIRIGLAGYFLAIFLQCVGKKADAAVPVFCTGYAVNMWMMTNFWQVTMLDTVIMAPLVLLGVLKMVRDRDMRLYPLMLGLSLFWSYYISIFTAILTGLFWIGLLIVLKTPWREVPKETLRFILYSVLGALIAAVALLPAVVGLRGTGSFDSTEFHWTEFYAPIRTMLGQLLPEVYPVVNNHPADIASSVLVVMLALPYLTASRIPLRERIYTFLVAAFVFVSLWYSPLNLAWHGFHYPYVTVDRFAYVLSMVLAFMGWRFTTNLHPEIPAAEEDTGAKKFGRGMKILLQVILMAGGVLGVSWCALETDRTDVALIPLCFAALMLVLYVIYRLQPKFRFMFFAMLILAVTGEAAMNGWLGFSFHAPKASQIEEQITPRQEVSDAIDACYADGTASQLFFRTGNLELPLDYELLYENEIGGSNSFSSTIPKNLKRLTGLLGMEPRDADAKYYYMTALPPVSTMLLDMQYVVANPDKEDLLCLYAPLEGAEGAYKFAYQTYPGFCIPGNITLDSLASERFCDVQNELAERLTGSDVQVMKVPEIEWKLDTAATQYGEASFAGDALSFRAEPASQPASAEDGEDAAVETVRPRACVKTTVPEDGRYWIELEHDEATTEHIKRLSVSVNDDLRITRMITDKKSLEYVLNEYDVFQLGQLKKGDVVSVAYYVFNDKEVHAKLRLSAVDEEGFAAFYEKAAASPLILTDFGQDRFTGTVEAKNDSILYLSMPYREGWTAYVDGAETTISPVLDGMSGVPVSAGQHTVRFEYKPPMLFESAMISCGALLLWLLISIFVTVKLLHKRKMDRMLEEALHRESPAAEQKPEPQAPASVKPAPKPQPETSVPVKPAPKPQPETSVPVKPAPKAPAQRPAETAKQRPGLYANHKPQRLTPEDELEARHVKGAHFAGADDDEDDNADD